MVFALLDLALFFGLVALVLYIIALTGVIAIGGAEHVFLVIAIILFIIWLAFRIVGECANGAYTLRNRRRPVVGGTNAVIV
jgi:steroid 5-alpha reductase family enzyme